MPVDNLMEKEIALNKSINLKYVVLVALILGTFFLMIKLAYEPVEPIIIMDEPNTSLHIANTPVVLDSTALQGTPLTPDSTNQAVLLPSESFETPPLSTSLPVETLVVKEAVTQDTEKSTNSTDILVTDRNTQQLTDIELAKKKSKQKTNKKSEEAIQQSQVESKPQVEAKPQAESQPQQNNVQQIDNMQQKSPEVVAAEVKKDATKAVSKEPVKAPAQEKSPWSKFADSIKHGGEAPCTPAQIAMNQCR